HARLVGGADPHALHDGAGLRLPVEMDREHADWLAMGLAAVAHAGAIGRDLRVAKQRLALDVAGDIVVARTQLARLLKPLCVRDALAGDLETACTAVGEHLAVEVAEPEIDINGVGRQDHRKPLAPTPAAARRWRAATL